MDTASGGGRHGLPMVLIPHIFNRSLMVDASTEALPPVINPAMAPDLQAVAPPVKYETPAPPSTLAITVQAVASNK